MVRKIRLKVGLRHANNEIASTFQSGLVNGGPAALTYGLALSWLGSLAVCASLAEMASMQVIPILRTIPCILTGPGRLLLVVNTTGLLNLRRLDSLSVSVGQLVQLLFHAEEVPCLHC